MNDVPKGAGLDDQDFHARRNGGRLFAEAQANGELVGKAGLSDFVLDGGDIVVEALDLDALGVGVVDDVGGFWIAVARLADGTNVDEVATAGFDLNGGPAVFGADGAFLDERKRAPMGARCG